MLVFVMMIGCWVVESRFVVWFRVLLVGVGLVGSLVSVLGWLLFEDMENV